MPRFIRFGSLPIGGLSFVCILLFTFCPPLMAQKAEQLLGNAEQQPNESDALEAVSYTHLTLPTICSV